MDDTLVGGPHDLSVGHFYIDGGGSFLDIFYWGVEREVVTCGSGVEGGISCDCWLDRGT